MDGVQDPEPFTRLVAALEPWLDRVVIVGGWAHRLYRLHPHAQELDYPPLTIGDRRIFASSFSRRNKQAAIFAAGELRSNMPVPP